MTHKIFFISDHHLNHANILTFKDSNGNKTRPFDTLTQMHEYIIDKHNSVVRPTDKVYFLGDVAINKSGLPIIASLNGNKRLVRGNHDIFKTKDYMEYFNEVHGIRVFHGLPNGITIAASHVPVHPDSLSRWKLNVHGHYHTNHVKDNNGNKDRRYYNVSVDYAPIDYTPVDMEQLIEYIQKEVEYNE